MTRQPVVFDTTTKGVSCTSARAGSLMWNRKPRTFSLPKGTRISAAPEVKATQQ